MAGAVLPNDTPGVSGVNDRWVISGISHVGVPVVGRALRSAGPTRDPVQLLCALGSQRRMGPGFHELAAIGDCGGGKHCGGSAVTLQRRKPTAKPSNPIRQTG